MRSIVGTYVDQQDIIRYPLDVVAEHWGLFDGLYWFGSDENNCQLLEQMREGHMFQERIRVVNLHYKIHRPPDIGVAQTMAVAWMRENDHADLIGYQEADEVLTPYGERWLEERMKTPAPTGWTIFAVSAIKSQLYMELTWHNPQTLCIMNGNVEYKALGDGWENYYRLPGEETFQGFPPKQGADIHTRLMVDLGYMGTDAYYRKLVGHYNVWKEEQKKAIRAMYDRDIREGIKWTVRRVWDVCGVRVPVFEYDGVYKEFIDRLGLYDDYLLVKSVVGGMDGIF